MENKHRFVFHPEGAVERETVRCSPNFLKTTVRSMSLKIINESIWYQQR